jgi:hypothetical protein
MVKKPLICPDASPQRRFQAKESNIKAHQEMVDSDAFSVGTDAALLEYAQTLAETTNDMNSAAAAGYRLKGAVELLNRVKTLAELPKPSPITAMPSALRPTEPPRRA